MVDDDEKVIGVISETDLLVRQARLGGEIPTRRRWRWTPAARRSAAKAEALTAGQLMSTPPVTVHADDSIAFSARLMAQRRVERLPVLDEEDRLVGIVTRRDLLQVFLRPDAEIRENVIEEVVGRTLWLAPNEVGVKVVDGVVTLDGRLERDSEVSVAENLTARIEGVVAVVSHLTSRFEDARLQPASSAVHGVADDWFHKP